MKRTPWGAAALAAVTLTLTLGACTSSSSTAPPQVFTPQSTATATGAPGSADIPGVTRPANPVPLIRKAGATPKAGERYGTTTADGWLSADGTFPSGESITLYTLPAGLTGAQAAASVGAGTSDSQIILTGPNWYAFVYPAEAESSTYPTPPALIAKRLGGTVQQPGGA